MLTCYCVWSTAWSHQVASRRICKGIEIEIENAEPQLEKIVRNGVELELQNSPYKIIGNQIGEVNVLGITRRLKNLNIFENVRCMVTANGRLRVVVEPMIPVMRVFSSTKSYYINKDGKYIEARKEFFADVPIVRGEFINGFSPKQVLPLINFIREDSLLSQLVSMVDARDSKNFILVPRIYGHLVNFGDTTNMPQKRRALSLFYRNVMPYKGWSEYDTISVKYRGQVVATRRNKLRIISDAKEVETENAEELGLQEAASERID